ncbi:MAG: DnaB-like helicase C-terminal domain-containing protein, partial [Tannerellaceae bacterium]|nr:DnaB-like helicase C-terminal domain-containing protein [Tannerellaceae bacterium]
EFDAITGGLHNGELYVGAGRPSDGKSAVALQIAMNAARAGKHVCFFSLEMTDTQIVNRLFAGQGNIDPAHLRISGLTEQEMQEMEELVEDWKTLPFYLNYTPSNNVETIRAQAMLQARKGRCDLVVVDYLHLLDMRPGKGETLEQVIARNIRALKRLANELDRPVLVLSQMNRASETRADRRHLPILSDLRDSGTIEQVADCVFFIYRPERHGVTKDENTGESLIGVGKLYIAKNRNGATGIARYRYNKSYTRITDY